LVPSFDRCDDLVRVLCPSELAWVEIALSQEAIDRRQKLDDRARHASFEPTLGQLGEETLHRVEP
jgi:hypothetical protein